MKTIHRLSNLPICFIGTMCCLLLLLSACGGEKDDKQVSDCVAGDCQNGEGVSTLPDGGRYEGGWQNGLFHGHGRLTFADGTIYEGEFFTGKRSGKGTMTYPEGSKYEGSYFNDIRQGEGKFTSPDGSYYTGEWKDNKRSDRGKFVFPDGESYEGDWKDDLPQGQGKYIFNDGSIYEGGFDKDKRQGSGNMKYADGSVYDGEWKNDKRHGYGVLTLSDGSVFGGNWENDSLTNQIFHTPGTSSQPAAEMAEHGQDEGEILTRTDQQPPAVAPDQPPPRPGQADPARSSPRREPVVMGTPEQQGEGRPGRQRPVDRGGRRSGARQYVETIPGGGEASQPPLQVPVETSSDYDRADSPALQPTDRGSRGVYVVP